MVCNFKVVLIFLIGESFLVVVAAAVNVLIFLKCIFPNMYIHVHVKKIIIKGYILLHTHVGGLLVHLVAY